MGRYEQAEAVLLGTDQACADRCSAPVKARIWLYIGCVRGTGNADQDGARAAFEQALKLDSSQTPYPAYTDEETMATYRAVRAGMGLGPDTESVSLSHPPSAATGQRKAVESPAGAAGLPAPPPAGQARVPRIPGGPSTSHEDNEYAPGDPVPPGLHVEMQPRWKMVIGGAFVLGVGYLGAVLGAAAPHSGERYWWLPLPVLGPWISLATHEDECSVSGGSPPIFCFAPCVPTLGARWAHPGHGRDPAGGGPFRPNGTPGP